MIVDVMKEMLEDRLGRTGRDVREIGPDVWLLAEKNVRKTLSRLRSLWGRMRRPPRRLARIAYLDEQGREQVARITGVSGYFLQIQEPPASGRVGAQLVGDYQALDRELFWQQWKAWGGGDFFFEDGSPWRPGG